MTFTAPVKPDLTITKFGKLFLSTLCTAVDCTIRNYSNQEVDCHHAVLIVEPKNAELLTQCSALCSINVAQRVIRIRNWIQTLVPLLVVIVYEVWRMCFNGFSDFV